MHVNLSYEREVVEESRKSGSVCERIRGLLEILM